MQTNKARFFFFSSVPLQFSSHHIAVLAVESFVPASILKKKSNSKKKKYQIKFDTSAHLMYPTISLR